MVILAMREQESKMASEVSTSRLSPSHPQLLGVPQQLSAALLVVHDICAYSPANARRGRRRISTLRFRHQPRRIVVYTHFVLGFSCCVYTTSVAAQCSKVLDGLLRHPRST